MKLSYPYKKDEKSDYSDDEILGLLAQETTGHYLFGSNHFWHGGVHFTDKANPELKNKPIVCIADGTIVAYRINRTYLESNFNGEKSCSSYRYATAFCLVRHEYESPESLKPDGKKKTESRETLLNKVIELNDIRNVRNEGAEGEKTAEFQVALPKGTQLKMLSVGGTDKKFATTELIAFAGNSEQSADFPDKKNATTPKTLHIGDKVYLSLFTKNGDIAYSNKLPLFKIVSPEAEAKDIQAEKTNQNKLTFYSLYMHLLPWDEYEFNQSVSEDSKRYVITLLGGKSDGEGSSGIDERSSADVPKIGSNVTTRSVAKGTIYDVMETKEADGFEFARGYRCDKNGNRLSNTSVWFKTGSEGKKKAYVAVYQTPEQKKATGSSYGKVPIYWKDKAQVVAKAIEDCTVYSITTAENGTTLLTERGMLTSKSLLMYNLPEDSEEKSLMINGKLQTLTLIKCTLISGKIERDSDTTSRVFYLKHDATTLQRLREQITPAQFDTVVTSSMKVKQGDTLGYMGRYDTLQSVEGGVNSKHQLHFEIFTQDDARLDDFLDNKVKAKQGKDFLVLNKGAALSIGTSPENLLKTDSSDFPTLPAPYFDGKSPVILHRRILEKTQIKQVVAQDKTKWHQIPIDGLPENTFGFIKVTDVNAIESNQLDLRKLGFTVLKEHDPHALGYAGDELVGPEEKAKVAQTLLFNTLFEQIDQPDATGKKDGILTANEISLAYKQPILGDQLRKLIAYHPSEWHGKPEDEKWKKLEELLAGEENKALLKHEQERIQKLTFWEEVPELNRIPIAKEYQPMVYHFHPVEFIGMLGESELITFGMLKIASPNLSNEYINDILHYFNKYAKAYEVNSPYRIAHFLSQVGHESGFKIIEENLSAYTNKRLKQIYGCKGGAKNYDTSLDSCLLGVLRPRFWTETFAGDAQKIGNYVYANRMGNGDEDSGDGYKYRGRGIIQLTGKDNYQAFTNAHNKRIPNDQQDFVKNPDLIIKNIEYGIESGFYYWSEFAGLNSLADKGDTAIKAITKRVNGGENGLLDRKNKYEKLKKILF